MTRVIVYIISLIGAVTDISLYSTQYSSTVYACVVLQILNYKPRVKDNVV